MIPLASKLEEFHIDLTLTCIILKIIIYFVLFLIRYGPSGIALGLKINTDLLAICVKGM